MMVFPYFRCHLVEHDFVDTSSYHVHPMWVVSSSKIWQKVKEMERQTRPMCTEPKARQNPGGHVQCSDSALLLLIPQLRHTALLPSASVHLPLPPPVCCSYNRTNERIQLQLQLRWAAGWLAAFLPIQLAGRPATSQARYTRTDVSVSRCLAHSTHTCPPFANERTHRYELRVPEFASYCAGWHSLCVFDIPKAKAVLRPTLLDCSTWVLVEENL